MAATITADLVARIEVLLELGLGYLSMSRSTPTLSGGELQRLRLATALRSGLFGVVYVLDEPSAGLHPADAEPLLTVLDRLKAAGNSLFVVEHDMDVVRRADWVVDVGPGAGSAGGRVLHSGPVAGLRGGAGLGHPAVPLPRAGREPAGAGPAARREPTGRIGLSDVTRHNVRHLDVAFPLGVLTAVTGVSGSGKSTLVSQVLADVVAVHLGTHRPLEASADEEGDPVDAASRTTTPARYRQGHRAGGGRPARAGRPEADRAHAPVQPGDLHRPVRRGAQAVRRDGRGPGPRLGRRPVLLQRRRWAVRDLPGRGVRGRGAALPARHLRAVPDLPRARATTPRPSRSPTAAAPSPTCWTWWSTRRARSSPTSRAVGRSLRTLQDVGLGYLHLGQPATELSGGEAQRIKLASELQRARRGHTLYLLDEPTTGLHPADVEVLMAQLHGLVDAGNTVVVVEHDMGVVATADHVVDLGPGAGAEGGRVVAEGTPEQVAAVRTSRTAAYLSARLGTRAR